MLSLSPNPIERALIDPALVVAMAIKSSWMFLLLFLLLAAHECYFNLKVESTVIGISGLLIL